MIESFLSTRLVRGWSHLERQKGGIGLRGPGETQLETDRRLIGNRIKQLKKKLDKQHNQKNLNRYSRKKSSNKLVALVGYTNAGKTSLFNLLTKGGLEAEDKLFATLDTTTRRADFQFKTLETVLFSDTVGFISNLPTKLIESFKATLDDLSSADLLLHVVDISDKDHRFKVKEVEKILGKTVKKDINLLELLKRPDFSYKDIKKLANIDFDKVEPKVAEQIEVQAKYSGYIKRQEEEVERNRQHEQTLMPKDMDYVKVRGLSTEVIEKLSKYRPINLGQASRIQGITPAAISLLRVYLKKRSSSLQQTA